MRNIHKVFVNKDIKVFYAMNAMKNMERFLKILVQHAKVLNILQL